MSAPPPLIGLRPAPLDPFIGCEAVRWNPETRVLYLVRRPMTPTPIKYIDIIDEFIAQYNNPLNSDLEKRHTLYALLATVNYTRNDIHGILLGIIASGNLPLHLTESNE